MHMYAQTHAHTGTHTRAHTHARTITAMMAVVVMATATLLVAATVTATVYTKVMALAAALAISTTIWRNYNNFESEKPSPVERDFISGCPKATQATSDILHGRHFRKNAQSMHWSANPRVYIFDP